MRIMDLAENCVHFHAKGGLEEGFKRYTRPHVRRRLHLTAMTSAYFWSMGEGRPSGPPMPGSATALFVITCAANVLQCVTAAL